jgi:hypothetical protein
MIKKLLILVICLSVIVGIVDFINWKSTSNIIKKEMPTSGIGGQWIKGFGYIPFVWNGNIKGKITVKSSYEDAKIEQPMKISYWLTLDGDSTISDGFVNNGFLATKKREESDYRWQEIEGYIAYVEIGEKIYRTVYKGQQPVDYSVTGEIIDKNKNNLFYNEETPEQITEYTKFLLGFTHDSLHQFIVNLFNNNMKDVYIIPNIYAYRLDQIISGQIKYENIYEKQWTGQRGGKLLLIYDIGGQMRIRWFYNPTWIGCGLQGGGYQFGN